MQQREEAAAAKKQPTPTPKPPSKSAVAEPRAETKREPSAPKRPADAAEEAGPKPKRIKEGPSEPRGTTPLTASAAPRAARGPPLPAAELAELVAQLTRAMEAAPPDEEAIATVRSQGLHGLPQPRPHLWHSFLRHRYPLLPIGAAAPFPDLMVSRCSPSSRARA